MKLISYLPFPVPKVFGLVVGCARRVRFYSEEECSGCAYGIYCFYIRGQELVWTVGIILMEELGVFYLVPIVPIIYRHLPIY